MARETLSALPRDASGKSPVARRLRKEGRVPGVLYGADQVLPFSADALEVAAVLRHGATIVDVTIDGSSHISVIKDYQVHPLRGTLQHIDLQEVRMDQTLKSSVPLVMTGESRGVKSGGALSQFVHELNVESTAADIPERIEVDISALGMGDSLTIGDVTAPEGVTILDDPGVTVLSVSVPRGMRGAGGATTTPADEAPADGEEAPEGATGEAEAADAAGDAS